MTVIVPASAGDLFVMAAANPALRLTASRRVYGHRMPLPIVPVGAQIACSEAYSLFEAPGASAPFAIVGGVMLPTGYLETWFLVRPGGLAPSLLLALVRFARRLLAERPPAICFVRPENDQGARLAKLLGFALSGDGIEDHQQWRRGDVGSDQNDRQAL